MTPSPPFAGKVTDHNRQVEMEIHALIFDFDGLIVDTETPQFTGWNDLYREHGEELALERYVRCVGSTQKRFHPMDHLQDLVDYPLDRHALQQDLTHRVHRILQESDTLPGVRQLLHEAVEHGMRLAVASSSPRSWVEGWLERLTLREYFHCVRTEDDVRSVKPDPELFVSAAEGLGVQHGRALVFEDSHNGLTAAMAAGIRCVAVPNAITSASDFSGAALVLESLAEYPLPEIVARAVGEGLERDGTRNT